MTSTCFFVEPCLCVDKALLLQEWAGSLRGHVSQLDVRPLPFVLRCSWHFHLSLLLLMSCLIELF